MHPVQSPIFLKRVSKTENCSLLGRAAFQLKRDSQLGPLLEAPAGTVLSETLEGRAALSSEQTEWRVELRLVKRLQSATLENLGPQLESFSVEADLLARSFTRGLCSSCTTVPLHPGPFLKAHTVPM